MIDWRRTELLTDEQRLERARGRRDPRWWPTQNVSMYLPVGNNNCAGCDDCRLDREDEDFLADNTPERRFRG